MKEPNLDRMQERWFKDTKCQLSIHCHDLLFVLLIDNTRSRLASIFLFGIWQWHLMMCHVCCISMSSVGS